MARQLGIGAESLRSWVKQAEVDGGQRPGDIALDVSIASSPARVFWALTRDPGGWWGHPYLRADATGLAMEPRLGGLLVETWANGGAVVATVTGWSQDRYLELTGPFHLGVVLGIASFELTDIDGGTDLRFTFRAIGAVDADMGAQFQRGWSELVGERIKALLEKGVRLGIAPDPPA